MLLTLISIGWLGATAVAATLFCAASDVRAPAPRRDATPTGTSTVVGMDSHTVEGGAEA